MERKFDIIQFAREQQATIILSWTFCKAVWHKVHTMSIMFSQHLLVITTCKQLIRCINNVNINEIPPAPMQEHIFNLKSSARQLFLICFLCHKHLLYTLRLLGLKKGSVHCIWHSLGFSACKWVFTCTMRCINRWIVSLFNCVKLCVYMVFNKYQFPWSYR